MKKSVFSKLSFGFLALITMLIACNTPISSINNSDNNKSKPFKIKGGGRTYIPLPFDTYYVSPTDITRSGTLNIHYGYYPPLNQTTGFSISNKIVSISGEMFTLSGETNITGSKLFLPASFSSKTGPTDPCGSDSGWGWAFFYDWNVPAEQKIAGNIGLSSSGNDLIVNTSFNAYGGGAVFSGRCYSGNVYRVDGSLSMTIRNIMRTEDSIELSGDIVIISSNQSTNLTVTPSNKNRAWSFSIIGSNVPYSQNDSGMGDKNISFSGNIGTYNVEVHYTDDPTISATESISVVPFASPDPNATSNPNATSIPTSSPTVVPTPTPTPIPTPTPFCGTGKEMKGIKDMKGNPVCCPEGALCGVFGGTNKKKPSGTPSGSPSTTPSTNPSSNPTVTPSSNSTPNPTSSPDGGAGDGIKKKTGFLIVEDGKEIVSTVVDTKFSVLVTNLEDTDAWMLKLSGSDLVVASGIGSQIVDINSSDLNRGLPSGSYLDDGYYDLYLDINPEAKTFIGIDNTPPEFAVDYVRSQFDTSGNLVTYINLTDPIVNGVSSGINEDLQLVSSLYISTTDGIVEFKNLKDNSFMATLDTSSYSDRIALAPNSFSIASFGSQKIKAMKVKFAVVLKNLDLDKRSNTISSTYTDKAKNKIDPKKYLCTK